jgi:hypothetical protein
LISELPNLSIIIYIVVNPYSRLNDHAHLV